MYTQFLSVTALEMKAVDWSQQFVPPELTFFLSFFALGMFCFVCVAMVIDLRFPDFLAWISGITGTLMTDWLVFEWLDAAVPLFDGFIRHIWDTSG